MTTLDERPITYAEAARAARVAAEAAAARVGCPYSCTWCGHRYQQSPKHRRFQQAPCTQVLPLSGPCRGWVVLSGGAR